MPSIKPTSFKKPVLADMTAGDVIAANHVQEAKRLRDEGDYKERDVMISFRSAPDGLIGTIDGISQQTGFHKSVVTKCLSLHLMSWYQSLPQVSALTDSYKKLQAQADGHPDIWRKMQSDSYEFVCPRGVGANSNKAYMRTIAFVIGYLDDISDALGVPTSKLFLAGLCWSVSTNIDGWMNETVARYLRPESEKMTKHIIERVSLFRYVGELLAVRRGLKTIEEVTEELSCFLVGDTQSPNNHNVRHG